MLCFRQSLPATFGSLAFCWSLAAQALPVADLFWPQPQQPLQLTQPETFLQHPAHLQLQARHANWVKQDDAELWQTDLQGRYLQHLPLKNWTLSLAAEAKDNNGQLRIEDNNSFFDLRPAQVQQQLLAAQVDSPYLAVGGFYSEFQQGYSLQIKPHKTLRLFYKEQYQQQSWDLNGRYQDWFKGSPLLGISPGWITADLGAQVKARHHFTGWGALFDTEVFSFYFQKLQEPVSRLQQAELVREIPAEGYQLAVDLQLSPHWSVQLNQHHQLSPPQTTGIAWHHEAETFGQTWQLTYQLDADQQLAFYTHKSEAQLLFRQYTKAYHPSLAFNFNYRAVYNSNKQGYGLRYQNQPPKGWIKQAHLAYFQHQLDLYATTDFFPYKGRDSYPLDIQGAELLNLEFGIGYQWQHWSLLYTLQQLIPLDVQQESDKTTQPDPGTGTDSSSPSRWSQLQEVFSELPEGNLQTLTLQYRF